MTGAAILKAVLLGMAWPPVLLLLIYGVYRGVKALRARRLKRAALRS